MTRKADRLSRTPGRVAATAICLLLFAGLLLPFWMEYKSVSAPFRGRPGRRTGGAVLDSRRAFYCPACGATLSVPRWEESSSPPSRQGALTAGSPGPSTSELLSLSTGSSRRVRETISKDGGTP